MSTALRATRLITFACLLVLAGCQDNSNNTPSDSADASRTDTTHDTPKDSVIVEAAPKSGRPLPAAIVSDVPASCDTETQLEGGRNYRVQMPSRVDGAHIVFQVFEPTQFDCRGKHPLILEGHGFSGSRQTSAGGGPLAPTQQLTDAGYTVISIDQRGHGESGGTIRVMDPDHEGQDLIQIVDWAEAALDFLAYHNDNLLLGSVGGSYGGGYQYLLYNVDPDQRLDAMVPQITWHDLSYSLAPYDVVKSYWGLFLATVGDANTGISMDPILRSTLLEGGLTNVMPETAKDLLHYHSPSYFCDNERELALYQGGDTSDYTFDPLLQLLPETADGKFLIKTAPQQPYPVDVLMFQGFRDSLFNFNEAYANYECMRRAGGDVRLLTYATGHHVFQPTLGLIQEGLQNGEFFYENSDTLINGDISSFSQCGGTNVTDATLAWFNEKLRGESSTDDVIASGSDFCLSLDYGDAITTPDITIGGHSLELQLAGGPIRALAGPEPLPVMVPLLTLPEDAVIAGIPTINAKLSSGLSFIDNACLEESDPLLGLGTCDAILFAGIGVMRPGMLVPELIDEQVTGLRGYGEHNLELVGIAERLAAGDRLFLMIYGTHPNYFASFSRDLLSYAVKLSGSIQLPLLTADGSALLDLN